MYVVSARVALKSFRRGSHRISSRLFALNAPYTGATVLAAFMTSTVVLAQWNVPSTCGGV